MGTALASAHGIDPADITGYAGQSYVPVDARQAGHRAYAGYIVRGLDDSFLNSNTYGFAARADGYTSDHAVWEALADDPGLAVVDAFSVPRRANWGSAVVSDFRLSGFYLEDQTFAPVPVQIRDTQTGKKVHLTVIGVLADTVPYAMVGISTSQQTLAPLGAEATPTVWYFKVGSGVDPVAEADNLEAAFLASGMQATAQSDALHDAVSASLTFQYLILGFLGLGLVIGVAALGVISARSVVERRQQIGVLRAIGFQARMVQISFLVESLFVTADRRARRHRARALGRLQRRRGLLQAARLAEPTAPAAMDRAGGHSRHSGSVLRGHHLAAEPAGLAHVPGSRTRHE